MIELNNHSLVMIVKNLRYFLLPNKYFNNYFNIMKFTLFDNFDFDNQIDMELKINDNNNYFSKIYFNIVFFENNNF